MFRGQYLGHWQYSTEQDVVLAPHRTSILVGKTIYFTDKLFKKSKSGWRKKQQCSRSEVVLPPRRRYLSRDLNGRKAEILQGSFPGRAAHALGQEHAWCILEIARHLCSWSKLCEVNEVGNDVQQVVRKQIIQASWGMCNGLGVRDSYWIFLKKNLTVSWLRLSLGTPVCSSRWLKDRNTSNTVSKQLLLW